MDYTTAVSMENKGTKTVLAIYPNQLGFGYALMENALSPLDYKMVVSRPMSNQYLFKRIISLINFYEPEIVILEDVNIKMTRKSQRVKKLINKIQSYARNNNIPIGTYSRQKIQEVFTNFGAKTKYEIARAIAHNIPFLKQRLGQKRKIYEAEGYSMGIFSAISLAVTHYYLTD